MQMMQWPQEMRPREKLLSNGAEALSDSELLAIFLRTGVPGCNVVELANHLLSEFGSLTALLHAEQEPFCRAKGLGVAKYVQVRAIMEMARRAMAEQLVRETVMENADVAKRYVASQLANMSNERFCILMLDSQHRLISFNTLFQGTINQASVHPRVIVQEVLRLNAAAVILCHNHPSGIAEPSGSDLRITKRIQDALALIDVAVLDHLIVGSGSVVSLAERQQL